jgi:hypothetical protein
MWINEHKTVWRVAILALVLVAFMGPWVFDRIWVPSEYTCSAPFIRLDGDFCGVPLSGIWLFRWMAGGLIDASREFVTGEMGFIDWGRDLLFSLILFLLVLPVFSVLLLILRGDRRRQQAFTVVAWGLGAGIALWIAMSEYPRPFWALWGIWLYIGLAAGALILEVLTLAAGTSPSQG